MRPKDEAGKVLPPAHKRLDMRPYHEAAYRALADDPRAVALPRLRRLTLIDRAVDHVIDGDKPPKWIEARDHDRPGNKFLLEIWQTAVVACRQVKRSLPHV